MKGYLGMHHAFEDFSVLGCIKKLTSPTSFRRKHSKKQIAFPTDADIHACTNLLKLDRGRTSRNSEFVRRI